MSKKSKSLRPLRIEIWSYPENEFGISTYTKKVNWKFAGAKDISGAKDLIQSVNAIITRYLYEDVAPALIKKKKK